MMHNTYTDTTEHALYIYNLYYTSSYIIYIHSYALMRHLATRQIPLPLLTYLILGHLKRATAHDPFMCVPWLQADS